MSSTQNNEVNIVIRVSGMEILSSEIFQPDAKKTADEYNFTLSIRHSIDVEGKSMSVVVSVLIHGHTKDDKLAQLELKIVYGFSDVSSVFIHNKNENTIEMNGQLMLMIFSTSLSTTRGVLYAWLHGTTLVNAYLPIIDAAQFLPQPK
jgi:hypothetical protein